MTLSALSTWLFWLAAFGKIARKSLAGMLKRRHVRRSMMAKFDWHSDDIDCETPITENYKATQNVRRFMKSQCGKHFKLDRPFMLWIKDGNPKTMGDVADEWVNRHS